MRIVEDNGKGKERKGALLYGDIPGKILTHFQRFRLKIVNLYPFSDQNG